MGRPLSFFSEAFQVVAVVLRHITTSFITTQRRTFTMLRRHMTFNNNEAALTSASKVLVRVPLLVLVLCAMKPVAASSRQVLFGVDAGPDPTDVPSPTDAAPTTERTGCARYAMGSRSGVPGVSGISGVPTPAGGFCASAASGLNNMVDNNPVEDNTPFSELATTEECEAAVDCMNLRLEAWNLGGDDYTYLGPIQPPSGSGGLNTRPSGCFYMDEDYVPDGGYQNGNTGNPRFVYFNEHPGEVGFEVSAQYYLICQY